MSSGLVRRDYAPTTYSEAKDYALLVSKSDLAPKDYKGKPANVLVAIMAGAELGLSPMQSIQGIAIINGRPAIYGDALLALVQGHPEFEDIIEEKIDHGYRCTVKRRGRTPTTREFSMGDAKQAGLLGKTGPWTTYPARMCQMRARGFAIRDSFADVLRGVITAEEAADIPARPQEPKVRVAIHSIDNNKQLVSELPPSEQAICDMDTSTQTGDGCDE